MTPFTPQPGRSMVTPSRESLRKNTAVTGASLLARVLLFADLNETELQELSILLRRRRYHRGEPIFREGDAGSSLFVIEEGRVKLAVCSPEGHEIILDVLEPGDFFGDWHCSTENRVRQTRFQSKPPPC